MNRLSKWKKKKLLLYKRIGTRQVKRTHIYAHHVQTYSLYETRGDRDCEAESNFEIFCFQKEREATYCIQTTKTQA